VKGQPRGGAAYTGAAVPRHHYRPLGHRPLGLALLCAPLLWAAAWAAETPGVTVDPALARGPVDAAVTIVEFADFQCPSCKRAQSSLGQILKEFEGKVRLVHKDFPAPTHAGALPAAEAARCAAAQGAFWEYHDLLYLAVPDFARDDLVRYAGRLSLDRLAFTACLDGHQFRAEIEADVREGRALKLRGTPTFLVNGKPLEGNQPVEVLREAVRHALREARTK
jgi:protein-disulfide isomerase